MCPNPIPFDVSKRIQTLREFLDPTSPHYQREGQHANIRALIELYESGKRTDNSQEIWLANGKIVTMSQALAGPFYPHCEVRSFIRYLWRECIQLADDKLEASPSVSKWSNLRIPWLAAGPPGNKPWLISWAFFLLTFPLQLLMEVRLIPELGGDGSVWGVGVLNDTGSDIMTLLTTDLPYLGSFAFYFGWCMDMEVQDAGGRTETLRSLWVQVRLVEMQEGAHVPWSSWINENAIIRESMHGILRLSGARIRQHLYFATGPGNRTLAVSINRTGLMSHLPT